MVRNHALVSFPPVRRKQNLLIVLCLMAIGLLPQMFVQARALPRLDTRQKTVVFPNYCVGAIYGYDREFNFSSGVYRGKPLGRAQGKIQYSSNCSIGLLMNFAGCQDLSFLKLDTLSDLELLHSDRVPINIKTFAAISGLIHLKYLSLDQSDVTDGEVKYLEPLKELRYLALSHTLVSGSGLSRLECASRLEHLNLACCPLKMPLDARFLAFSNLNHLNLEQVGLDDKSVLVLLRLKKLATLKMDTNQKVTDASLKPLMTVPNLDDLNIAGTSITSQGAKLLLRFKKLHRLTIDANQMDTEDILTLRRRGCHVTVREPRFTPDFFAPLK